MSLFLRDFFMPLIKAIGLKYNQLWLILQHSKPMWSVCKKELRQFFSSLTGYIAIIVFLLVNGLVLFVFDDNIFDFGYATLGSFLSTSSLDTFIINSCHYHAQLF